MFEDPSAAYQTMDAAALQRLIEERHAVRRQIEQQIDTLPAGAEEIPCLKDRLWTVKAELLEMTYAMELKTGGYFPERDTSSQWQSA